MPIRTASMTKRISENGKALHRAMMSRGTDQQPSEAELALAEERRQLKEQRDERKAQALQPGSRAVDRLVRTHRAQAADKPRSSKDAEGAKEVKKPKARRSRAEKHAEQAAQQAARRAPKKAAPK